MSLAVVSLSGGMDSCVTASIVKRDGYDLALLHVDYGQLTEVRERLAFEQIADYFEVPPHRRLVVPMQTLKLIGGSSLTDQTIPLEKGNLESDDIPTSYVPFRNAHLLAACVSWAEVIKSRHIFVGFVEKDSSRYPDCRKTFLKAFEIAANEGTMPETKISIGAPVIDKTKAEIIKIGISINAPLHLTWSCYSSETLACGVCDSCLLRLRGFEQAGLSDPVLYKQHLEADT
ncbi:MAG: 7-cyano-7-deazaguanine synthase QueC [Holophagales bacterium]|jgi:7-cyano-7-deazaguanine synthase|nr:7-cyano-7-deazaguanine synthase QueC [Holophagales bacterium]